MSITAKEARKISERLSKVIKILKVINQGIMESAEVGKEEFIYKRPAGYFRLDSAVGRGVCNDLEGRGFTVYATVEALKVSWELQT